MKDVDGGDRRLLEGGDVPDRHLHEVDSLCQEDPGREGAERHIL